MRLFITLLTAASLWGATLSPEERKQNLDSFEYVWTTIRDKHWDKSLEGPEWRRVHDELRPKIERAKSLAEARTVIEDMISRLHLTHFRLIPDDLYSDVEGRGASHLDVRVIDGKALVVSGKYAGWEVAKMQATIARVGKLYEHSTLRDMMLARAVLSEISDGPAVLSDGRGGSVTLQPEEIPRKGDPYQFGNLPTQYVWTESRRIGDVGYVAFNLFLDPERLITMLKSAIDSCAGCKGFVIDLRGNSGGMGGMAMGMAGFFVSQPNLQLGKMITRESPLKFFINPRQPQFAGPLAVLVDGLSASTSEIMAGGLKDIGRARIFGSRTAGAALPSVIEKLPNGDAFQYAIANYISENGKPLEGIGVTPDVEIAPTRESLLAGQDLTLAAALKWLQP